MDIACLFRWPRTETFLSAQSTTPPSTERVSRGTSPLRCLILPAATTQPLARMPQALRTTLVLTPQARIQTPAPPLPPPQAHHRVHHRAHHLRHPRVRQLLLRLATVQTPPAPTLQPIRLARATPTRPTPRH